MSRFLVLFTIALVVSVTFALPAEEKEVAKKEVGDAENKSEIDRAVVTDPSSWDTYLSNGQAWNIVSGSVATIFLVGGVALGFYYFYYLNYYKTYNEPVETFSNYNSAYPPSYYPNNYYQATSRALSGGGSSISFARVLDMIAMAQETYEKFDFQSLDCQKKALCEFQQKNQDFGETGRKISNTFSFMDALDGLPMPSIIQTYLKEYKEAIMQGKTSTKDCANIYPKCGFSIKEVFVKYSKKSKNN